MKIAVFGATGGTGTEVVKQALAKGYEITAIARDPDAIKEQHTNLKVMKGDAMQPDSFAEALKGQDAVISVIGITRFFKSLRPMTFHRVTARNIVEQMEAANIKRLICVTSVGVLKKSTGPLFYKLLIKPLLENKYEDMRQMEKTVRESKLQWTIVRPYRLAGGKLTGKYRIGSGGELTGGTVISRADVADFILKLLESEIYLHKTPAISY